MINLNILNKKPKKLSIKFYLRRDISPIVYTLHGSNDTYYHLYIEFIYRRKVNKCKSRYFQFVANDSYVYSFIRGFEDSGLKGYNIYGIKESVFTDDVYAIINNDIEVDFTQRKYNLLELLFIEKQHLKYLFQMLFEIDEENFTLSRVSEGYQNSLKFMFDYFDLVIKELLQNKLNSILPFFPLLNTKEKFTKLATKLSQTLSTLDRSHPALENADIDSIYRYVKLLNVINILCERYLVFDFKISDSKGMTLPIWCVDNHSEKLKEYIYLQTLKFGYVDYSKNEIESIFDFILSEVHDSVQKDLSIVLDCFK
jgi:hypothetical protein